MPAKSFKIERFLGLNSRVKDAKQLKAGETPDSLNWLTAPQKDHIELRMGMSLLTKTRNTGNGKITGLGVGIDNKGVQIPYWSYVRKIVYYSAATGDFVEVSSNLLPTAASGEDVAFAAYQNLAGSWMYWSSPNSSIYKIHLAFPGTFIDMAATDTRGFIQIDLSRIFLWNIFNSIQNVYDKNNLLQSYADKKTYTSYTQTSTETVGSGDGATKTFTKTLAQVPGSDHQTAFAVTATDGTEIFTDDGNGTMTGTLGGTGTINYISGALSITFKTAPSVGVNNVTTSYYTETKTHSIVDFSFSNPRTSGQGAIYPEMGGGFFQNSFPFNGVLYNFHLLKSWQLTIPSDDTTATDTIYRESVGIPYWRAGFSIDDGILYLDFKNKADPMIRFLTLRSDSASVNVVPEAISDNLDLTKNGFDVPVAFAFGNFYMISCQGITNGTNDTVNDICYVQNKLSGFWDKLDYGFTCAANYNGNMIVGDTISNNVFQLFSGYDDDGAVINNYWLSGQLDLEIVTGQKRCNRMTIDGYINPAQSMDVYINYDNGAFAKVATIAGTGAYVDNALGILVGTEIMGTQIVGSGATVNAYHFRYEFMLSSPLFEYLSFKLVATAIGALQVNSVEFKDIREKGNRTLQVYEKTN